MSTETKDALDLPRVDDLRCAHLSELPAVRWLDHNGAVRMGRLLRSPGEVFYGVAFDELTHNVYLVYATEYEPNVQKDNNGNPK